MRDHTPMHCFKGNFKTAVKHMGEQITQQANGVRDSKKSAHFNSKGCFHNQYSCHLCPNCITKVSHLTLQLNLLICHGICSGLNRKRSLCIAPIIQIISCVHLAYHYISLFIKVAVYPEGFSEPKSNFTL